METPRTVCRPFAWRDPLEVLGRVASRPFAFALLSDGSPGARWSYVGATPTSTFDSLDALRAQLDRAPPGADRAPGGAEPPFQGGAVGLATYEFGATLEATAPQARRQPPWPDFTGGLYDAVFAFDHAERRAWAVASAPTHEEAQARARRMNEEAAATPPLSAPPPRIPSPQLRSAPDYAQAVAEVVAAIGTGEIFQANIARVWKGRLPPQATPFDLLRALHALSPAPFAGYLRLPGAALVSRSPERFISVSAEGLARTSPIKGTRPRGADAQADTRLRAELVASAKDRAENRMIVDVMRNDLARTCRPGSVEVEAFCEPHSFSNVHHLVSTVRGRLAPGRDALDLFAAAFPPASVTGAPKLQAMRVIARHEPPRGPYCGCLFRLGYDGAFDSNVLIRTLALDEDADGWRWEARAGAGVTADSDPQAEDAEAMQKARAVLASLPHD